MNITQIYDVFSEKEILFFDTIINNLNDKDFNISKDLGRLEFTIKNIYIDENIILKLTNIAKSISKIDLMLLGVTYVEYNSKYGVPNLPPHFDGDSTDLLINYQLSSNTFWDIGLNFNIYNIKDNSALIFNPNKEIHWRPNKIFKDQEFIKMIFFRFVDLKNYKDNSHLSYSLDHKIFKGVNDFRDTFNK